MTVGQIAGLIAAIAFLLLVIFIGLFLMKVSKTISEVNSSVRSMTSNIDVITKQTDKIMATSNSLVKDVDEKLNIVTPVFQAAADLGESVSSLNKATQNLTGKVKETGKKGVTAGIAGKFGKSAWNMYRNHRHSKNHSAE
ncbi:DUF948 domain-containing protein [Lentilactobacillus kisonensis]|uniref:Uncharacterized protein n=2 Tax=Lentilactobacillus kisonensis TaxID=481722 RepID=H1LJL4_9LACO|nr:DUF948 domain-containing protein [Lentilactobacillus kisonensis]EHO48586.1 hypothetical protein HMPREF9104_02806 [Lentilactobacillus kisonensis F0435]KRL21844.1 hypothetical protein FC98_GL000593 [Lentilactobacillus kisonensis DSM 19906 = JCM 15041]